MLRILRNCFLLSCQIKNFRPVIFSRMKVAMEHFIDRRSPFPSPKFYRYSKLKNMGKWEAILNVTIASLFSKRYCEVRVYSRTYPCPFFSRRLVLWLLSLVQSVGQVLNLFSATSTFQHWNGAMDKWRAQLSSARCSTSETATESLFWKYHNYNSPFRNKFASTIT